MTKIKVTGELNIVPTKKSFVKNPGEGRCSCDVEFEFEGNAEVKDMIMYKHSSSINAILIVTDIKDNKLKAININITENPTSKIKVGDKLEVFKS